EGGARARSGMASVDLDLEHGGGEEPVLLVEVEVIEELGVDTLEGEPQRRRLAQGHPAPERGGDREERSELAIAGSVAREGVSHRGDLPDVGPLPEARAALQMKATVQTERQLRKTALGALPFGGVSVPEHAGVGGAAPLAPGVEVDPLR